MICTKFQLVEKAAKQSEAVDDKINAASRRC